MDTYELNSSPSLDNEMGSMVTMVQHLPQGHNNSPSVTNFQPEATTAHSINTTSMSLANSVVNTSPSPMPWFPSTTNNNFIDTPTMREMIFKIAAMQPIHIDPETVKAPKRRNVKISKDPQSVAARLRRERISERIRILQRLVPGGTKMDTASMLDEAVHYLKFLKSQVESFERVASVNYSRVGVEFPVSISSENSTVLKPYPKC